MHVIKNCIIGYIKQPRYNGNIVESGVKHYNPNPTFSRWYIENAENLITFLKFDPYRVWCSIFYSKLVNCILFKIIVQHVRFVKGKGTCGSGKKNVKIWIDFPKFPRFPLTSPLSQVALFLLCVVSPESRLMRKISKAMRQNWKESGLI
jgi:hypothetical protein